MLSLSVTKFTPSIYSSVGPDKIYVTIRPTNIFSHNDTKRYVEPFVYIDGGLYDNEGTVVDAEYYDTALWAVTWNGGYV
jgi:hypothetical protein